MANTDWKDLHADFTFTHFANGRCVVAVATGNNNDDRDVIKSTFQRGDVLVFGDDDEHAVMVGNIWIVPDTGTPTGLNFECLNPRTKEKFDGLYLEHIAANSTITRLRPPNGIVVDRDVIFVTPAEADANDDIPHAGWVRVRRKPGERVVYETLVAVRGESGDAGFGFLVDKNPGVTPEYDVGSGGLDIKVADLFDGIKSTDALTVTVRIAKVDNTLGAAVANNDAVTSITLGSDQGITIPDGSVVVIYNDANAFRAVVNGEVASGTTVNVNGQSPANTRGPHAIGDPVAIFLNGVTSATVNGAVTNGVQNFSRGTTGRTSEVEFSYARTGSGTSKKTVLVTAV